MSSVLSRLFKHAVLKTVNNEGMPAKLGKADGSTLFYVDDAGTHHKDRVWARIGAGAAPAEAVVRCVSVPQTLNLPVIVADRDGVLTVIRTDLSRAVEWADGQLIDVSPHNWTHGRYGSDALYVTGLSFLPLAAYPSDTPDLTVTVEQCFYRYQNTHKVFERTISDSLTAYRPTGLNITHYVILALDRSTNALAVIDGDDVSGGNRALPSASTVLATDGLRSEHFPICAIRFYNGQTQIMPRDIFMDLRLWAGESSASGSGSSGSAAVRGPDTSTDHAIARWDGTDGTLLQDSYPTIDDSGNVDMDGNELRDYSHQIVEANTGAAYEIDWAAAGIFELTLTDDPTFTFINESAGRAVTLILIQDGTGSRTVTWPGTVEWANGIEPRLAPGANDVDSVTLICRNDGSAVSGFAAGLWPDNESALFGTGADMDIGYDGTDGYLRIDLVAPSDLNLDCGAAKTLELQAVVYEDLQVSINNLARGAVAPTDRFYDHGIGAGVAYPVLGFAKNDYVWFDVQTHHAMKLNTVLDNHIHFTLPDTTTIGHKFVFQLDVIAAGINGTWAVPAGSPFTSIHTVAANDNTTHRLLEIGDIPSSNTTVSTVYKCKLTRIDGEATEYASEVYLQFSDCHYQKDTMGSRQEGVK